jgi:cytidyltransferase-like protein
MRKTGITNGVFDLFHQDHKRLIDICKKNCDYLIVYIDSDEFVILNKGRPPLIDFVTREKALLAYGADEVRVAHNWHDPFDSDFDIFFFGSDQLEYDVWNPYFAKLQQEDKMFVIQTGDVHSRHLRQIIEPFLVEPDTQLLQNVVDILEKNNIEYCAIFGTLIGICRNNKKIPWDNDYDLVVFNMSYWEYYDLVDLFSPKEFYVTYDHGFIQIKSTKIRVDIFRYDPVDEFAVFSDLAFKEKHVFPMRRSEIDGVNISIPNRPEEILDTSYPNWKTNFNVWKTFAPSEDDINC